MVLARFLPQDERYFDYFHKAVENAAEVAQALGDLLNHTFVTPLDREDITDLAGRLDDFVDAIEQAVRRIWLYRIDEPTEHARLLARIIGEQAALLASTVPHLENRRQWDHLLHCTIDIQRLENEADDVLDRALMEQFEGVNDVHGLIKGI